MLDVLSFDHTGSCVSAYRERLRFCLLEIYSQFNHAFNRNYSMVLLAYRGAFVHVMCSLHMS